MEVQKISKFLLENWPDVGTVIALFTVFAALLAIYTQIRTSNRQLNAQSYISYTQKYDSIIESMPDDFWENRDKEGFSFPLENELLRKKLHSYFQLCCQQYYMHNNKLISYKIWKMWKTEIDYNLSLDSLKKVWLENEIEYFGNYREFKKYVNDLNEIAN